MNKFALKTVVFTIGAISGVAIAESDFNPYECTPEELIQYIENRKEGMERGTPVKSWNEFKSAYVATQQKKGNDECAPFWEDNEDIEGLVDGVQDAADAVSEVLSDPGSALANAANSAKDRLDDLTQAVAEEMVKGVCERLSEDTVTGAAEDRVEESSNLRLNLDSSSNTGLMDQIKDQTVCGSGEDSVGGRLEYGYSGNRACDAFEDSDNRGDRARENLAEDAVDDAYFDEIDQILWGE